MCPVEQISIRLLMLVVLGMGLQKGKAPSPWARAHQDLLQHHLLLRDVPWKLLPQQMIKKGTSRLPQG